MIDTLLWIVAGFGAVMAASHLSGSARLAAWQALTPWVMAPSLPVGVFAALSGRWWLTVVTGVVSMVFTVLAWPLLPRRVRAGEGPQLRVLFANVKYDQSTPDLAARALVDYAVAQDVDVLAASEVTVTLSQALEDCGLRDRLPFRVGEPVTGPEASVLWTRRTVIARGDPGPGPTWDADATIDLDGIAVRVVATHPLPPVGWDMRPHWQPGLRSTAERARHSMQPVLVVGDFNAARWHRAWRRFVDRSFVSAHEALGRGWTCSWPDDRWYPPFVRLDHALCGVGLQPVGVVEVRLPGSDHRGFVVTVAAKARTARPR